jgi:hypothetical protein
MTCPACTKKGATVADETKAMQDVLSALLPLDDKARMRVLGWASVWVDDHRRPGPFGAVNIIPQSTMPRNTEDK